MDVSKTETYRINILCEISGGSPIIILHVGPTALRSERRHQAHVFLFVIQLVQCQLQFGNRKETNENLLAENRKSAIEFSSHDQNVEFFAKLGCRDQWRIGDVNDTFFPQARNDFFELDISDRVKFVVQEGV